MAILIGSTRHGRFAPVVANWFAGYVQTREEFVADMIDLAETALPDVLSRNPEPTVEKLRSRLAVADAFVIITPEYNQSFPAPLKTAIDWYSKEWSARPVAFVSHGGNAGGLRAVEQLRQVFAELHAVTVRNAVGFAGAWSSSMQQGTCATQNGTRRYLLGNNRRAALQQPQNTLQVRSVEAHGRPRLSLRRFSSGNSGSIRDHSASLNNSSCFLLVLELPQIAQRTQKCQA